MSDSNSRETEIFDREGDSEIEKETAVSDACAYLAHSPWSRHHPDMGQDPTHHCKSDLFPTAQEASPSAADRVSPAQKRRHVLPKDLPNAVKHLNDEEFDRLLVVTLAEAKRRGRSPPNVQTDECLPHRPPRPEKFCQNRRVEETTVSLTRGQLNAVRAAFKAGITPARIARQFGLSQSHVRTALKSDEGE